MHIAFLTKEYPPLPGGGIGTSIRNLGRALVAQGHQVTVVGWAPEATAFEDAGVHCRFLRATRLPRVGWLVNRLRAQRELNRLVREAQLAVVEAPDWCGLSAGMRLHCPLLVRCHGSATYFAHLLHETVRPAVRFAERLALRRADGITAVSRFTADVTALLFDLPSERIGVIHNGIDLQLFTPAAPGQAKPGTILYFGTLTRKKGVLDLADIFNRVAVQSMSALLQLVGHDNPDRQSDGQSTWSLLQADLSDQARTRAQYLGTKPYAEMQACIRQAAVCAFPSYAEAFPLAWLEAMACGKPVVAYDIGWAPEIIEHESNGLLVAPGDRDAFANALLRLLNDRTLSGRLGAHARRRIEECFTSDMAARQTVAWYSNACGRQSHRAPP